MFAEMVRVNRLRLGRTQEELAGDTGLSVRSIRKIEAGQTRTPRPATVRLLADAFGLVGAERERFCHTAAGVLPGQPERIRAPAQLPADVPAFTGRAGQLASLESLLTTTGDRPGIVVIAAIDGMAGIGKTALALRAAHRVADRYPQGQLFIDLHGYAEGVAPVDPGEALDRMLRALGVPGEQIPIELDERAALYRSRVAGQQLLILLDNAATEAQVQPLLPGTASCLVLITSRRRLAGLDHAHTISLNPLPLPDAITLFTRTAGEHRLTTEPADLVAEAVHLCGRLPLAIRIAAARIRAHPSWTLTHLLERLRDHRHRLAELAAGQRNVTAALDLSYQQLTTDQQRMYRLLGLHPGPDIDPYAAAALANTALAPARRLLDQLLDAHLLQEPSPDRFVFHDLVRVHAIHTAETTGPDPDRQAALTRLYDHYRHTTATAMDTAYPYEHDRRPTVPPAPGGTTNPDLADPASATTCLDAELPNLLATARHAAEHNRPEYILDLSAILHRHLHIRGHHRYAQQLHLLGLATARATGDRTGEMKALSGLAWGYIQEGEYDLAADHYHRLRELVHSTGDRIGEICLREGLGDLLLRQGRPEQAISNMRRALELAQEIGDPLHVMWAANGLGYQHLLRGELAPALDHHRQALAVSRATGDHMCQLHALLGLGHVDRRQGRPAHAIDHYQQALDIANATDNRTARLLPLLGLGDVHRRSGRHQLAAGCYQQALDLVQESGDRHGQFEVHHALGRLHHATGHPDRALAHHQQALDLITALGQPSDQARVHDGLAHAHQALGQPEQAGHHWQRAMDILTSLGADHTADEEADVPTIRAHLANLSRHRAPSTGRAGP